MSYYNTIGLTGASLKDAVLKAKTQEEAILEIFYARKGAKLTPSKVLFLYQQLKKKYPPVTSIRRAICRLTDAGHLVKLADQRLGNYGRPEHCWTLNQKSA